MKTWLGICLLLLSTSGCGLLDEYDIGLATDEPGHWQTSQASQPCNAPPPATVRVQSPEPELAISR
jgi:hypothetical protein